MYDKTLNFGLGEDIDSLREMVRRFAEDRIAPIAAEIDRSDEFPRICGRRWARSACIGITAEEEYGGSGMGYVAHVVAMEEVSRASASSACPTARIRTSASTRSSAGARRSRRRNTCRS
jgi:isovaleryl-CoA dehydrogenase